MVWRTKESHGHNHIRKHVTTEKPTDQAETLRRMMADLEAGKTLVGYYDRLCPYCNGKLADGERIHPWCSSLQQQECRKFRG